MMYVYAFLIVIILLQIVEIFYSSPKRRHEKLMQLFAEHVNEERQKKGIDAKIIQIAMSNKDPASVYAMLAQAPSAPILKKSMVENFMNDKTELSSKIMAQISKNAIDFFDKIYVMSYNIIDRNDCEEARKDMKALLNMLELAEYAGYKIDTKAVFNPTNKYIISSWSKHEKYPLCKEVALKLEEFYAST